MPKGLIPLMLPRPDSTSSLSSRSSTVMTRSPTRVSYSPPVSYAHRRNQSDIAPVMRMSRPPVRPSMKRSSQQLPASLPQIPYSPAEWKSAISEIKRYHVTRRYRACSARCNEILTNRKNISAVEPAYLIYLHFYAATSLEMCAGPLAPASTYRISLLQQARAHYERAAALIRAAENAALLQTRVSSAAASVPNLDSPSDSTPSRAWTPESDVMTPTSCSLSRPSSLTASSRSSTPRPSKKKVSFELPCDKSPWSLVIPEPFIRPDSPTLGFDEDYFAAGAMRQELPDLPSPSTISSKRFSRQDLEAATAAQQQQQQQQQRPTSYPMPSICERDERLAFCPSEITITSADSPSTDTDDAGDDEYPFFPLPPWNVDTEATRALGRYCETLAALKVQVASHSLALEDILAKDLHLSSQAGSESPILQDASSLVATGSQRMSLQSTGGRRQSRRGSVAVNFSGDDGAGRPRRSTGALSSSSNEDGESEETVRERKARIDRLKMSGWRRKRFDASRYEELCDVVLAELNQS